MLYRRSVVRTGRRVYKCGITLRRSKGCVQLAAIADAIPPRYHRCFFATTFGRIPVRWFIPSAFAVIFVRTGGELSWKRSLIHTTGCSNVFTSPAWSPCFFQKGQVTYVLAHARRKSTSGGVTSCEDAQAVWRRMALLLQVATWQAFLSIGYQQGCINHVVTLLNWAKRRRQIICSRWSQSRWESGEKKRGIISVKRKQECYRFRKTNMVSGCECHKRANSGGANGQKYQVIMIWRRGQYHKMDVIATAKQQRLSSALSCIMTSLMY